MTTVVVADDQPAIVSSLTSILDYEPDLRVVATATNGPDLVDAIEQHRPDVALVDVRMPGGDGLTALTELTRRRLMGAGGTKVIVLTTFDLDDYVEAALRAGAKGFLIKTVSFEQVLTAVRAVASGDTVLAPGATGRLVGRYLAGGSRIASVEARTRVNRLTPREIDVLRLVGKGHSNSEIAALLVVSGHTVKTHFGAVLFKCRCRDRAEAIVLAYDAGLVSPGIRET